MAENPISDFDFYLRFAKRLVLSLVNNNDKFLAAAWLKKLMAETSGEEAVRTYYLKLLLVGLQQRKLIGPFQEHPCKVETLEPFPQANVMETVEDILKEDKKKRQDETIMRLAEGDLPPFICDFSADLLEYVAVQEIKNFGVHGFYATSKQPLNTWHRADKTMFPKAAKSMIEVSAPPMSLMVSPSSTPEVGKTGGGDGPQATSTPKKKKRKQVMSTLGASPPVSMLGKIVDDSDDRVGSPPTWGSNLLQVNETNISNVFEDVVELDLGIPRLNAGGGGNRSPGKPGGSTGNYDLDELASLGLRPEDLEDINLDDLGEDDFDDDGEDDDEEGFQASDQEIDEALDRYEKMIADLEAENAEDIAKYGEDAGPSSPAPRTPSPCPASTPSRSPSPCPASIPSRSPSPCPAAVARSPTPVPSPLPSPRTTRSPNQTVLVSPAAREILDEAAEVSTAPAQSNVPRTKPVSRLPTRSVPASAKVVVKPPAKLRPRQVYGPVPRYMAGTSATRSRNEPPPPPSRIGRPSTSRIGTARRAPATKTRPPPSQDEQDLASQAYWENFNRQLESEFAARPATVQIDDEFDDSFDDLEIAIGREMRARGEDPTARQEGTCPGANKDPEIGKMFDAAARAAKRRSPQRRAREQMRQLMAGSPKQQADETKSALELANAGVSVENLAPVELADLDLDLDDVKVPGGRATTSVSQRETEYAAVDSYDDLNVQLLPPDSTLFKIQESDNYAEDLKHFSPALSASVPTTSPRPIPSPRRAPRITVIEAESPPDYSNVVGGSPRSLISPRPFQTRPDERSPGREENLEAIEQAVNQQMVQQGIDNESRRRILNSPTTKAKMAELNQTVQEEVDDLMDVNSPPKLDRGPAERRMKSPTPPRRMVPAYELEEGDDADMLDRTIGPASIYSSSPDSARKPSPVKDIVKRTAQQPVAQPKHQYLRKGKKKPESAEGYITPAEDRRFPRQRQPARKHKSVMRMAVRRRLDFEPEPDGSPDANEDSKVEVEHTETRIMDEGPYTEQDYEDVLDRTQSPGLVSSRGSPPRASPRSPLSPMSRPETMAQVLHDVRNYDGQLERKMSLTSWSRGDERRALSSVMAEKMPGRVAEDEEADLSFEELERQMGTREERSMATPGRDTPQRRALEDVQKRAGQQLEMLKSPPRTPPDVRTQREKKLIDQRARIKVEREMKALLEEEQNLQITLDIDMPVGIPSSPRRSQTLAMRSPRRVAATSPRGPRAVSAVDAGWAAAAYGDDDDDKYEYLLGRSYGDDDDDDKYEYLLGRTSPPISPPGSPEMQQAAEFQKQWSGMAGDAEMLDDEDFVDYGPSPPPSPDAPSAKHRRLTVVTPETSVVQNTDLASPSAGGVQALNAVLDDVAMAEAVTKAATGMHVPGSYSPRSKLNKASMVKKTPEGEKILLETTKMKTAKPSTGAVPKRKGPPKVKQTRSAMLRAKAGQAAKAGTSAKVRAKATKLDPKEAQELGLSRADLKDLSKLMSDQWKAQDRQEKDARKKLQHMYAKLTPAAREELTPALFSGHRIVRDVAKTQQHRLEEFGVTDEMEWRDAAEVIAEDGIPSPPPRVRPVTPWEPKTPPKHHAESFATQRSSPAAAASYAQSTPLAIRSPPRSPTGSPESMFDMKVRATRAHPDVRPTGGRTYHTRTGKLSPVGEFIDDDMFELDSRPMEEFFDHGAGLGPIRTTGRPATPVVGNVASPRTPKRSPAQTSPQASPPSTSPLGGPGSPTRSPLASPPRRSPQPDGLDNDFEIEWDDDLGYGKEWEGEPVTAPSPPSPETRRVHSPETLQKLVRQHQMSPEYHDKSRQLMTRQLQTGTGSPRLLEDARSPGLRTVNESLRGELPQESFLPGPQERVPTPERLRQNVERHQYTQHMLDRQRAMLSRRASGTKQEKMVPVRNKARLTKLGPLWEVRERVQEPWRSPIKPYPEIQSPEQLQQQVTQHRMTPHYADLQRKYLNKRVMLGTGTEAVVRGRRTPDLRPVAEQRESQATTSAATSPRLGQLVDTSEGVSVLTTRDNRTGQCIGFERNRIQAPYTAPSQSDPGQCPGDTCGQ